MTKLEKMAAETKQSFWYRKAIFNLKVRAGKDASEEREEIHELIKTYRTLTGKW
jgi:hypothetical protein